MTLIYTQHKGSQLEKPKSVDITSSKTSVFLRKNIKQITRVDERTGEVVTLWSYDECKLSRQEYDEYLDALNLGTLMSDVEELETSIDTILTEVIPELMGMNMEE